MLAILSEAVVRIIACQPIIDERGPRWLLHPAASNPFQLLSQGVVSEFKMFANDTCQLIFCRYIADFSQAVKLRRSAKKRTLWLWKRAAQLQSLQYEIATEVLTTSPVLE